MPQNTEYACPTCEQETGELNQIVAAAGELRCTKNGEHRWNDSASFVDLHPKMVFAQAPPKALPQQNHTKIEVSVPMSLERELSAKFGEKMSATVSSILAQMVEGKILIVGQTDIDRIAGKLGSVPQNSSELYGMIYAKTEEVIEAKQIAENAVKDLKAYEGLSPGRIVVNLGDQIGEAASKASDASLPVNVWAERALRMGLENSWF